MGLFNSLSRYRPGMTAQRLRMDVIANNVATRIRREGWAGTVSASSSSSRKPSTKPEQAVSPIALGRLEACEQRQVEARVARRRQGRRHSGRLQTGPARV